MNDTEKNVEIIRNFFKGEDWRYSFDAEANLFGLELQTLSELGYVRVAVQLSDEYATSAFVLPMRATKGKLDRFSRLVNDINFHLVWGAFRLDPKDGEMRFQYVMPSVELQDNPTEKARKLMELPQQMLCAYGGAIMRVALGPDGPGEPSPGGPCPEDREAPPETDWDLDDADEDAEDGKSGEDAPGPVKDYTLDGLNIRGDFSLDRILAAVRNFRALQEKGCDDLPDRPRMNILLWGPPGTGKSEFVNYLGQQLGCKVVVKMASDMLNHMVGKTEKAIRSAFKEAEKEHAILFLDELDGLMADRADADANWQVTQVNEILHCMERFNGIMIGATNFRENLDSAVLRRFTYKVEFDYLEAPGKRIFFDRVFKTPLTDEEGRRLEAIPNLAPGDFRTVSQQLYYLGTTGNAARLAALEVESGQKKILRHAAIGFGPTC